MFDSHDVFFQKYNKSHILFFFGQLAVDKHYHSLCPEVLYRANDDLKVFPKLHLDQVTHRHIYVPVRNQVGVATNAPVDADWDLCAGCSKVLLSFRAR